MDFAVKVGEKLSYSEFPLPGTLVFHLQSRLFLLLSEDEMPNEMLFRNAR